MRKGDFQHSSEESNGNSSDEEENKLPKCGRKCDLEILNEKKKNINEEEEIGIRKFRRKIRIDKYNEEVRGWKSSSKNPERPPDTKKNKRDESFRKFKKKVKTSRP